MRKRVAVALICGISVVAHAPAGANPTTGPRGATPWPGSFQASPLAAVKGTPDGGVPRRSSVSHSRFFPTPQVKRFDDGDRFVPGEVLVKYQPGVDAKGRATAVAPVASGRLTELRRLHLDVLRLRSAVGLRSALATLEADPRVEYAEPNFIYQSASTYPNDPQFPLLWGLENTGQSVEGKSGSVDADIDAAEAWDLTTGSESVRVAVVDTGVAYDHPDLAPNMLPGWDYVDGDADPYDLQGHGTHVAGTIGARGNDGFGVSGVSWRAGIIPVRVLGEQGEGTTADIIAGMDFAVRNGAKIVNLSLGGDSYSQAMADMISSAPNVLFVAAAGNGGPDGLADNNDLGGSYPCSYPAPNIVCVAATGSSDSLTRFSNYGSTTVDLAAPGSSVLSTQPAFSRVFSDDFEGYAKWTTGGTSRWGLEDDWIYGGYFASDSPYGSYSNNADNWIDTLSPISLAGKRGCRLNYWLYLDTELDFDGLLIQASKDGTNWTTVSGWTGYTADWYPFTADLSAFDEQPSVSLSFRLLSDGSTVADGAYVDDVSVDCNGSSYSGTEFDYMNGTSMATPHVAGVAALLWARNPSATVSAVKNALLGGVDKKASLDGKMVGGGRLNALGSLSLIAPPSTSTPSPTPTPTPTPSASPTPTPTPSASPTPTPTPTVLNHTVGVSLRLGKHLIASGRVASLDGTSVCGNGAAVRLSRKTASGWKLVKGIRTDSAGYYRVRLPDRVGRYRALVPAVYPTQTDYCYRATSVTRSHRH